MVPVLVSTYAIASVDGPDRNAQRATQGTGGDFCVRSQSVKLLAAIHASTATAQFPAHVSVMLAPTVSFVTSARQDIQVPAATSMRARTDADRTGTVVPRVSAPATTTGLVRHATILFAHRHVRMEESAQPTPGSTHACALSTPVAVIAVCASANSRVEPTARAPPPELAPAIRDIQEQTAICPSATPRVPALAVALRQIHANARTSTPDPLAPPIPLPHACQISTFAAGMVAPVARALVAQTPTRLIVDYVLQDKDHFLDLASSSSAIVHNILAISEQRAALLTMAPGTTATLPYVVIPATRAPATAHASPRVSASVMMDTTAITAKAFLARRNAATTAFALDRINAIVQNRQVKPAFVITPVPPVPF